MIARENGGWEIHYNVYITDPATGSPQCHYLSRVVGYPAKMRKSEAENTLAAELTAINSGPITRVADGIITLGNWIRKFYVPTRGANWRPATRRRWRLAC